MRERILELLQQNPEKTFSITQIAKALEIPADRNGEFTGVLSDLTAAKLIACGAKKLYSLPKPPEEKKKPEAKTTSAKPTAKGSLTGSIKFMPNGHAFFYPIIGDPENEGTGIDFTIPPLRSHRRYFPVEEQIRLGGNR
jgi:predicted small lipoprotein YifL